MVNVVGVRLAHRVREIVVVRWMKPVLKVHASQAQAAVFVGTTHAMPQRTVTLVLLIVALASFVATARAMARRTVALVLSIVALALLVQIVLSRQVRVYARTVLHHALPIKIAQK